MAYSRGGGACQRFPAGFLEFFAAFLGVFLDGFGLRFAQRFCIGSCHGDGAAAKASRRVKTVSSFFMFMVYYND